MSDSARWLFWSNCDWPHKSCTGENHAPWGAKLLNAYGEGKTFGRGSIVIHQPDFTGPIRSVPDAYLGQSILSIPLLSHTGRCLLLPSVLMLWYCKQSGPSAPLPGFAFIRKLVFVTCARQNDMYSKSQNAKQPACMLWEEICRTHSLTLSP